MNNTVILEPGASKTDESISNYEHLRQYIWPSFSAKRVFAQFDRAQKMIKIMICWECHQSSSALLAWGDLASLDRSCRKSRSLSKILAIYWKLANIHNSSWSTATSQLSCFARGKLAWILWSLVNAKYFERLRRVDCDKYAVLPFAKPFTMVSDNALAH